MSSDSFYFDPDESNSGSHPARHDTERDLSDDALKLLDGLPDEIRPIRTAARFPHIMNRLAKYWRSPKISERYFDELLIDQRGGRQGFPLGILSELFSLKEYYLTKIFPRPATTWDDAFIYHSKDRS